jgi:hypothetical protein
VCYAGLRSVFARFPWNTAPGHVDAAAARRPAFARLCHIPWPYGKLSPAAPAPFVSMKACVVVSLLAGWWGYVAAQLCRQFTPAFVILLAVFMALTRLMGHVGSYSAPISLWGRIRNGIWLIPGYDKVFLAPACIVAAGFVLPWFLRDLGVPVPLVIGPSLAVLVFMSFSLPPSNAEWNLAGHCGIRKGVLPAKPAGADTIANRDLGRLLGQALSGKNSRGSK